MFWKKKKARQCFAIPDEHTQRVALLLDAYIRESSNFNRYRLWKFLYEICPEFYGKSATLDVEDATRYFIREQT
jgi:hypothetical protein